MGNYICYEGHTEEVKEKFLKMPKGLYEKGFDTQDIKVEQAILEGKHILSKDFSVWPIVVETEEKKLVGRCLVTFYPDDEKAYVGFYECIDDSNVSLLLLRQAEKYAATNGKVKMIGPVDASFWIKYRFKINHFEKIYTSEPYNKEYYKKQWDNNGFVVSDHYSSNQGRVPLASDVDEKCKRRYDSVLASGYELKNPTDKTFEKDLRDVYELIIKLYADFPGYKYISSEQFVELFRSIKPALNYDMVFFAYKNDKMVGFFVNVPNYGNATAGSITFGKLLKILKIRKKPKEYVLLYMGAELRHAGLGGAFAQIVKDYMQAHNQSYIGALIHDGKVTNQYYSMLNYDRYEYVLMEKTIQ